MTDFYDQFTEFISWFGQTWFRGVKAPVDVLKFIKDIHTELNSYLTGMVHPYFVAVFSFAIGIALLHKLSHLNSKG